MRLASLFILTLLSQTVNADFLCTMKFGYSLQDDGSIKTTKDDSGYSFTVNRYTGVIDGEWRGIQNVYKGLTPSSDYISDQLTAITLQPSTLSMDYLRIDYTNRDTPFPFFFKSFNEVMFSGTCINKKKSIKLPPKENC